MSGERIVTHTLLPMGSVEVRQVKGLAWDVEMIVREEGDHSHEYHVPLTWDQARSLGLVLMLMARASGLRIHGTAADECGHYKCSVEGKRDE